MAKIPAKQKAEENDSPLDDDPFVEELTKRVVAIVGKNQAPQVIGQVLSLTQERFRGPIAHPRHLREYEDICPGAADRIISMAENQLDHAKEIQTTALQAEIDDSNLGRKYGFFALLSLILAALICAVLDKEILAGAFLGTGVLGVVGLLIDGKSKKSAD